MKITEINETHTRRLLKSGARSALANMQTNPYEIRVVDILAVFNGEAINRGVAIHIVTHNTRAIYLGKVMIGLLKRLQGVLQANPSMFEGSHSWAYLDSIARVSVKPDKRAFVVVSDVGKVVLVPYLLLEDTDKYIAMHTTPAFQPGTLKPSRSELPAIHTQFMLNKTGEEVLRLSTALDSVTVLHNEATTRTGKTALNETMTHLKATIDALKLEIKLYRDSLRVPLLANRLAKVAGTNTEAEYVQALQLELKRLTK